MKSFRIDDEAALSEDRVLQAIYAPSLGKRSRSDVVKVLTATRKAKQIKRSARICWKQAAAMLSYMGWIDHTSTYGVFTARIAPFVSIRRLKRVVSKHARRESHGYHLEKDRRLPVRGTGCA